MQETTLTLLEETSELLNALTPILQRNIDALQHDSNPLLQHLIQQEIESYQQLLERTAETKDRLQDLLDSQEDELDEVHLEGDDSEEVISEETEPKESDSQEVEPEVTNPDVDISPPRTQLVSDTPGYPPDGWLAVTMPNGERISHRYAPDIFVEVLEKIGLERIEKLDITVRYIPLVSIIPDDNVRQRQSGKYYITVDTHWRYMTTILLRIAATFNIDLIVGNNPLNTRKKYKKYLTKLETIPPIRYFS